MRRPFWTLLLLVAPLWLGGGRAQALSISIERVGGSTQTFTDADASLGCTPSGGQITCTGTGLVGGPAWTLDSWTIDADADPFVNANIALTNTSGVDQTYVITVSVGASTGGLSSLTGGSAVGTVTVGSNAGSLTHSGTIPFYQALIDGSSYQSLLNYDSSLSPSFGSASTASEDFGLPGLTQPGPVVTSDIGVKFTFTLTAGDQASFTSFFEVVPVPEPTTAALVLLGLAGLGLARRRA